MNIKSQETYKFIPSVCCLLIFLAFLICLPSRSLGADASTGSIIQALRKLQVLGRVLYIAAHPDDENTNLITYLRQHELLDVAYLSLTRGDGGQNLIGPELGDSLGVIRSQELLQARAIDGGQQFFTRAIDFGYSKTPRESLAFWGKEKILEDVVRVIRSYQPDVVITRFPPDGEGHGHHSASAVLAREAFDAAGDPTQFPDLLKPWKTTRLVHNLPHWYPPEPSVLAKALTLDVSGYNPLSGQSYSEIASASRTMHKSQGFGTSPKFESQKEYFINVAGTPMESNLMQGIETTWNRLEKGDLIKTKINQIIKQFEPISPWKSIPALFDLRRIIQELKEDKWRERKLEEVDDLIYASSTLHTRFISTTPYIVPATSSGGILEVLNQDLPIETEILSASLTWRKQDMPTLKNFRLVKRSVLQHKFEIELPADFELSNVPWLRLPKGAALYNFPDSSLISAPKSSQSIALEIKFKIANESLTKIFPLTYYENDPVRGEISKPVQVVPPLSASLVQSLGLFPDDEPREFQLTLKAWKSKQRGTITLDLPTGWIGQPTSLPFSIEDVGETKNLSFSITPPKSTTSHDRMAFMIGNSPLYEVNEIAYPHIDPQIIIKPLDLDLLSVPLSVGNDKIGFIEGSGEGTPEILRQLGYIVKVLSQEDLDQDLSSLSAIIVGIRALNTKPWLSAYKSNLLNFVRSGGVVLVEYQTNAPNAPLTTDIWPFPMQIGRSRTTEEDSPVRILDPSNELVQWPHKISIDDFDGWVQERGLYFVEEAAKQYEKVLGMNDTNEASLDTSIVTTRLGAGRFTYTGLSFFRELPAGVPGAYRLFINLISRPRSDQPH